MTIVSSAALALTVLPSSGVYAANSGPQLAYENQDGGGMREYIGHYYLSAEEVEDRYIFQDRQRTYGSLLSIAISGLSFWAGAAFAMGSNRETQNWQALTDAYYSDQGLIVVIYESSTPYVSSTDVYMAPN